MSKARILLVAAATFLAAVFVGCSLSSVDDSAGVTVSSSSGSQSMLSSGNNVTLSCTVPNAGKYVSDTGRSAGSARTILPPVNKASEYKYYLYGKSASSSFGPEEVDVTVTDGVGKFEHNISAAYWTLILFAVESGTNGTTLTTEKDMLSNSVLIGYSSADLSSGSGSASFILSTEGLTGNATIKFPVVFANEDGSEAWTLDTAKYTVTTELQNMSDGKTVKTLTGTTSASGITYATSGVTVSPPGTYNYVVTFTETATKRVSVWSDVIVLVANREITDTVYVPNIIGKKPAEVDHLYVGYIKDSENSDSGKYKVHFTWDATSVVNEREFEFELVDVTALGADSFKDDTGTATDGWNKSTTLVKMATPYTSGTFYDTASPRVDGSLIANNKDLTIYLDLGKAYFARIRAKNYSGESDWTYLEVDGDSKLIAIPDAATDYFTSTSQTKVSFGSTAIHRAAITYDLAGGTYTPRDATPSVELPNGETLRRGKLTQYYTADTMVLANRTVYSFWEPLAADASGTPVAELLLGKSQFTAWYKGVPTQAGSELYYKTTKASPKVGLGVQTAAAATAANYLKAGSGTDAGGYQGLENLKLYASYSSDLGGTIEFRDPNDYDLLSSWIQYKTSKKTTATAVSNGELTLSKSGDIKNATACAITFSLKIPDTDGVYPIKSGYTNYNVKIKTRSGTPMYETDVASASTSYEIATLVTVDCLEWSGEYVVSVVGSLEVDGQTIKRNANVMLTITD